MSLFCFVLFFFCSKLAPGRQCVHAAKDSVSCLFVKAPNKLPLHNKPSQGAERVRTELKCVQ